jgi:hypothetical protein
MEPWWTSVQAGWIGGIGGSVLGLFGAALGTIGGICAPRGKCKGLVHVLIMLPLVAGLAALIVGLAALGLGQPYHVWYPLLIFGIVGTAVMGGLLPVFRARYREADQRRLEAEELRRS